MSQLAKVMVAGQKKILWKIGVNIETVFAEAN